MRCRHCGKPCKQTSAESIQISDGVFQTTRYYKCTRCGKTYEVTDEPQRLI